MDYRENDELRNAAATAAAAATADAQNVGDRLGQIDGDLAEIRNELTYVNIF